MSEPIAPNSTGAPASTEQQGQPISAKQVRLENAAAPKAPTTPEKPEGTETVAPDAGTKPDTGADDTIDYKEKFAASTTEAQRMLKIMKDHGIDPKTGLKAETPAAPKPDEPAAPATPPAPRSEIPTPKLTDKELAAQIPGFENMSEDEKEILRDVKAAAKRQAENDRILKEMYDERQYEKDFKKLVKNDKWKTLADHAEEFHDFAYQDANLQTPLETLAASFLYEKGQSAKPAEDLPPAPAGVEPGTHGTRGGAPSSPDDGMTEEEAAELRTTDPKRYMKLARTGKLKIRES